jgi:hypothetical protein
MACTIVESVVPRGACDQVIIQFVRGIQAAAKDQPVALVHDPSMHDG